MTDYTKLGKLIGRLQAFIAVLEKKQVLQVHQRINQSYYMQKVAELQLLHDRLLELHEKQRATCHMISLICPDTFNQFRKDLRWLQKFNDPGDESPVPDYDLSM